MSIRVPLPKAFDEQDTDYLEAPELADLAEAILAKRVGDGPATEASILYRWKREGGSKGGKDVLGKCAKTSPLIRSLTGCQFFIWLAADYCQVLSDRQIEALLHHELRHIGGDENGKLYARGHDFELFAADLQHYGPWHEGLEHLVAVVTQLRLPLPAGG